jgi:hypothetical protein
MNDRDLDECYTALSQALAAAGEDKAPLLLATLSLSLLVRERDANSVLQLIARALQLART